MLRRGPDSPFIGREIKQNESHFTFTQRAHSEKRRTRICWFVCLCECIFFEWGSRPLARLRVLCFCRCIMQISMQLVEHDLREAHQLKICIFRLPLNYLNNLSLCVLIPSKKEEIHLQAVLIMDKIETSRIANGPPGS